MYFQNNFLNQPEFILKLLAMRSADSLMLNKSIAGMLDQYCFYRPLQNMDFTSGLETYIRSTIEASLQSLLGTQEAESGEADVETAINETSCGKGSNASFEVMPASKDYGSCSGTEASPEEDNFESYLPPQSEDITSGKDTEPQEGWKLPVYSIKEPSFRKKAGNSLEIQPSVVETHDFFIVRVAASPDHSPQDFRVGVGSSHVSVKCEKSKLEQIIKLPPDTNKEEALAHFKDGVLEISIPKEQGREKEKIDILPI